MWDGKRWWKQRTLGEQIALGIGLGILGLVLAAGLFALYGWIVMLLWNWLMPELFGLKTMNFWQALGLPLLLMLLFMGVGGGNSERKDRKRKRELRRSLHGEADGHQD